MTMHTYEIAVKTTLVRKTGWNAILFAVFHIQTALDKFPAFGWWVQISIPTLRLAKPRSSGSSAMHPSAQPRHHVLLTEHSHCSHPLPRAPVAPAQPAAIWPPFLLSHHPPIPSQTPHSHRVGLDYPSYWSHWCSPVPKQQVMDLLASLAAALSRPFLSFQPCVLPTASSSPDPECACWNSTAYASCSALLSGSHQPQVSFFEISLTTASVPSGLSSAICKSVIFHLDCNASEHRAFAFTWLLISRCLTVMSLFLF